LDILTLYKLNLNLIFFNTKSSEYNSIEKIKTHTHDKIELFIAANRAIK